MVAILFIVLVLFETATICNSTAAEKWQLFVASSIVFDVADAGAMLVLKPPRRENTAAGTWKVYVAAITEDHHQSGTTTYRQKTICIFHD